MKKNYICYDCAKLSYPKQDVISACVVPKTSFILYDLTFRLNLLSVLCFTTFNLLTLIRSLECQLGLGTGFELC